ncbi:techylectin-like protein [Parasteatoda tepidariorum]|uniref:techylectin-like protein n=1 Tax=Parasteatoda tepidariorum TaxID=114398 RepID=UPI00077F9A9F|nr:techylectin-5A-like [Parasteatoda tepidariorum]
MNKLIFVFLISVCLVSAAVILVTLVIVSKGRNTRIECDNNGGASSFLDVAEYMIEKAKDNYPICPTVKLNLTSGPVDCEELLLTGNYRSGSYTIWPRSRIMERKSLQVYCDMDTDGGGWTLIQRRGDFKRPEDYFYQDWLNYKTGFGHIEKDFWLGNDNIFSLTNQNLYSIRFDLKDVEGAEKYAAYDVFWIDDETQNYTLHIRDYSGNAGDCMTDHNGMKFSTKDVDNDLLEDGNCASLYSGGWWYNACHSANLNGMYAKGKRDGDEGDDSGVEWKTWSDFDESFDTTEIKIRSKSFKQKIVPFRQSRSIKA